LRGARDTTIPPAAKEVVVLMELGLVEQRPATDQVVIRKVDHNGSVSFAGADYRAGNAFKGRQVEVCLAGDTVQIWGDGRLLRTHAAKHDRRVRRLSELRMCRLMLSRELAKMLDLRREKPLV
jgi:hypothetical protein